MDLWNYGLLHILMWALQRTSPALCSPTLSTSSENWSVLVTLQERQRAQLQKHVLFSQHNIFSLSICYLRFPLIQQKVPNSLVQITTQVSLRIKHTLPFLIILMAQKLIKNVLWPKTYIWITAALWITSCACRHLWHSHTGSSSRKSCQRLLQASRQTAAAQVIWCFRVPQSFLSSSSTPQLLLPLGSVHPSLPLHLSRLSTLCALPNRCLAVMLSPQHRLDPLQSGPGRFFASSDCNGVGSYWDTAVTSDGIYFTRAPWKAWEVHIRNGCYCTDMIQWAIFSTSTKIAAAVTSSWNDSPTSKRLST